jgi:hypothetical protein
VFFAALLCALPSSVARAQSFPSNASLAFEAWNGSSWVRHSMTLAPGQQRVEVRAVVDYFGPPGSAYALGSVRYQPVLSDADNTGTSVDSFAPWRNGGVTGTTIPNSLLSVEEGDDGGALPSYGRVGFGSSATNSANLNVITTFRHGGDSPLRGYTGPGAALRVAGSFVSTFPGLVEGPATAQDINSINRGLVASQSAGMITPVPDPNFREGLTGLVIFRAAILLGDGTQTRTLGTEDWSQARLGSSVGSTDNRRFSLWLLNSSETVGSLRVDLNHIPLSIVVPAPMSLGVLGMIGFAGCARRRRTR